MSKRTVDTWTRCKIPVIPKPGDSEAVSRILHQFAEKVTHSDDGQEMIAHLKGDVALQGMLDALYARGLRMTARVAKSG